MSAGGLSEAETSLGLREVHGMGKAFPTFAFEPRDVRSKSFGAPLGESEIGAAHQGSTSEHVRGPVLQRGEKSVRSLRLGRPDLRWRRGLIGSSLWRARLPRGRSLGRTTLRRRCLRIRFGSGDVAGAPG